MMSFEFSCMRSVRPKTRPVMLFEIAFFVAMLSTALALGAALAHLLEMSTKLGLSREQYFVVQSIYSGWDKLAFLLAIEAISIATVIVLARHDFRLLAAACVALACLAAAQVIFWTYTFPANVATQNWTSVPANWEDLRRQWEYSHAAGAIFQMLAMCALIVAAATRAR
jgi:hypothetical protein